MYCCNWSFSSAYLSPFISTQPTDEDARVRLVEEVKNRAKACIAQRNFPEAVNLYTKGIELTSADEAAQAIIYANRSMCQLNMGKGTDALVDADEALRLDASYIKGYYRQAMAHTLLNNFTAAKQSLIQGLTLKPDDKEMATQLKKVEEKISIEANKAPVPPPRAAATVTTKANVSSSNTTSAPSSSSRSGSNNGSGSMKTTAEKVVVDEEEDLKNLNVRGYKQTADGRKTTFFNHELDEETKKLIGNIAPKKLEAQGEVITAAPSNGSVWNSAGTYEEKILTPWVTEYLRSNLGKISTTFTTSQIHAAVTAVYPKIASLMLEITSVESISGDAQVTLNRGKKKHVCDFTTTLKWNLLATMTEGSPVAINGQLSVIDITADREYEIDNVLVSNFNETSATLHTLPKEAAALVNKYVKSTDVGLQQSIHHVLDLFWNELKTK